MNPRALWSPGLRSRLLRAKAGQGQAYLGEPIKKGLRACRFGQGPPLLTAGYFLPVKLDIFPWFWGNGRQTHECVAL